ncbi:hypothetical protein C6A85_97595, partial [Mycobacterium sp. ITM-2017-0098]
MTGSAGPAGRLLVAVVALLLAVAPSAAPPIASAQPAAVPFLRVQIDSITPDVVTTTSDQVVTITGTIDNVGDRPVRDVVVRLERAAAVASSTALRTDLAGNVDQYQPVADFITVAPELARGQKVPFRLAYPLRSEMGASMRIGAPGVYPLMVNVNGTPDYGAAARLDDSRLLLPILGVPPVEGQEGEVTAGEALDSAIPPDTTRPVGLTV